MLFVSRTRQTQAAENCFALFQIILITRQQMSRIFRARTKGLTRLWSWFKKCAKNVVGLIKLFGGLLGCIFPPFLVIVFRLISPCCSDKKMAAIKILACLCIDCVTCRGPMGTRQGFLCPSCRGSGRRDGPIRGGMGPGWGLAGERVGGARLLVHSDKHSNNQPESAPVSGPMYWYYITWNLLQV